MCKKTKLEFHVFVHILIDARNILFKITCKVLYNIFNNKMLQIIPYLIKLRERENDKILTFQVNQTYKNWLHYYLILESSN